MLPPTEAAALVDAVHEYLRACGQLGENPGLRPLYVDMIVDGQQVRITASQGRRRLGGSGPDVPPSRGRVWVLGLRGMFAHIFR
ncbi:hypothetical protein HOK31_20560 [Candidatus Poribacteria bacterium]|nr:hypothetical protein [Candidatus Poribacteria bacterium]MBT7096259.1 hypothetical protein [Candidatus Poribacteria bacterium]